MAVLRSVARFQTILLACAALATVLGVGAWRVALPRSGAPPAIRSISPADGARGVAPRTAIIVRFTAAMNTRSVMRALTIDPALPATLGWDAARHTLTITPGVALAADTEYRLTIGTHATDQFFRPLAEPARRTFRSAAAPAIVLTLPASGALVDPDTAIAIQFGQPMVNATLASTAGVSLTLDPPTVGQMVWVGQDLLLFQPDAPLLSSTVYAATLAAGVPDMRGGTTTAPVSWAFRVAAPVVVLETPAPGDRVAGPRAPLVLRLSHQLPLAEIRRAFAIDPALPGVLEAARALGGGQIITFTPGIDWYPERTYQVTFTTGSTTPPGMRFEGPARPQLVARFPGEGQLLSTGSDIRLVFAQPVSAEQLRDTIQFDPPVDGVAITSVGGEARITANLRPSAAYTLTVAAALAGRDTDLRIRTASLPARLTPDPQVQSGIVRLSTGVPLMLPVQITNIATLSAAIYALDDSSAALIAGMPLAARASFEPARYQLPQLAAVRLPIGGQADLPTNTTLTFSETIGLAPGFYLLRLTSSEGPRADLLVVVGAAQSIGAATDTLAILRARDPAAGTPLMGQPAALYSEGVLLRAGQTDASGRYTTTLSTTIPATVTLVLGGTAPDVVAVARPAARVTTALDLFTDASIYRPGELITAFVVTDDATRAAPADLVLRSTSDPYLNTLRLTGSAALISGTFRLGQDRQPAFIRIGATRAGKTAQTSVVLLPQSEGLDLVIEPLREGRVTLVLRTSSGAPVPDTIISWQRGDVTRARTTNGDATFAQPAAGGVARGTTTTDAAGRATLAIDLTEVGSESALIAWVNDGDLHAAAVRYLDPAPVQLGIAAPGFAAPGSPFVVRLVAQDLAGRPIANIPLRVSMARQVAGGELPADVRELRTDTSGSAQLRLSAAETGIYQITVQGVATSADSVRARVIVVPEQDTLLVERVQRGATAELQVVAATIPGEPVLVAIEATGVVTPDIRVITPTTQLVRIADTGAAATRLTLFATGRAPRSAALPATADPVLLRLTTDRMNYAPGTRATLIISATDATGAAVEPPVLLTLTRPDGQFSRVLLPPRAGPQRVMLPLPAAQGTLRISARAVRSGAQSEASIDRTLRDPLLDLATPPLVRVGDEADVTLRATRSATAAINATLMISDALGLDTAPRLLITAPIHWRAGFVSPGTARFTSSAANSTVSSTTTVIAPPTPPVATTQLLRSWHDPQSGALRDPAQIRAGEMVEVRLTIAITTTDTLTITDQLPAGVMITQTADARSDRLTLVATRTLAEPGIVVIRYQARAIWPGRFHAPAASATDARGTIRAVSIPMVVTIIRRE